MTITRTAALLISIIAIVYILIIGQGLLTPFIFATLLWALVREVKQFIDKNKFVRERIWGWLKSLVITAIFISVIGLTIDILISSTKSLARSYALYESNVTVIANQINDAFDIDLNKILKDQLENLNFANLFSSLLNGLTTVFSSTFMILLYALFIFLEEANFSKKLLIIFKNGNQHVTVVGVLEKIEDKVTQYLGLKVLISLMTGLLSYIALLIIGVDGPAFWAFLIFLLNFIPTIGSLIATLFPAIFSLLQFGEFLPGLWVIIIVGSIQVVIGNVVEPRLMGNSLNLSSLVAIMSLMFWGAIWGITGMLLSIPITVILVIILSEFPQTKNVAIMLSKDGKINE